MTDQQISNWANTIKFNISPSTNYFQPTTINELKIALEAALTNNKPNGKTLRFINSGHGWSPGIVPGSKEYPLPTDTTQVPIITINDAILINITGLSPANSDGDSYLKPIIIEGKSGTPYASIPAGMTQGSYTQDGVDVIGVGNFLQNNSPSYALSTMGPAPQITMGGFIANGCHGTGWTQPTVSDLVFGIEVMTFQPKTSASGEYDVVPMAYAINQDVADAMQGQTLSDTVVVSADTMAALRVSLGSLGVITKLVLSIQPTPLVEALDEIGYVYDSPSNNNDVAGIFQSAENLETLVTSCEYTEIFWFPFNASTKKTSSSDTSQPDVYGNELWVKRFNQAPDGACTQNEELVTGLIKKTSDLADWFGAPLAWIIDKVGFLTPEINHLSWSGLKKFMNDRQMTSLSFSNDWNNNDAIVPITTAFLYQLEYFTEITDLSWAVPITQKDDGTYDFSKVITAWNTIQEGINDSASPFFDKKYPVNLTVHLRFIKNSSSLLSPANQTNDATHTCFIEFLSFSNDLNLYKEFTANMVDQWTSSKNPNYIGGLPHFAKAFQYAGPDVYSYVHDELGSRLTDFQSVRDQFDPGSFFENNFLDQVLNLNN